MILIRRTYMTGKVKRFNAVKGFGFIECDGKDDIFFHYSELVMDGYKTVAVGDNVEFEISESEKGERAVNIRVLK